MRRCRGGGRSGRDRSGRGITGLAARLMLAPARLYPPPSAASLSVAEGCRKTLTPEWEQSDQIAPPTSEAPKRSRERYHRAVRREQRRVCRSGNDWIRFSGVQDIHHESEFDFGANLDYLMGRDAQRIGRRAGG